MNNLSDSSLTADGKAFMFLHVGKICCLVHIRQQTTSSLPDVFMPKYFYESFYGHFKTRLPFNPEQ